VVLDFVGEQGAEADAWGMTRDAGSHHVIGYGGTVQIPTLDIISTERNIIGNLVGSYNELVELMALAAKGKVALHTRTYALGAVNDAMDDLEQGRLQGAGSSCPTAESPCVERVGVSMLTCVEERVVFERITVGRRCTRGSTWHRRLPA